MKLPPLFAAVVMLLSMAVACKDAPRQQEAEVSASEEVVSEDESVRTEPIVMADGPGTADSSFTSSPLDSALFARINGLSYGAGCTVPITDLRYLCVLHWDLDGQLQEGEMICNRSIAADLLEIFRALYDARYPIGQMRLIDDFEASDELSMQANNTSCFVFRRAVGQSRLSAHAYGMAVDINPLYNPFVKGSKVLPACAVPYADRSADFPCKLTRDDLCTRLFLAHGFRWGGSWRSCKDWQHFEK